MLSFTQNNNFATAHTTTAEPRLDSSLIWRPQFTKAPEEHATLAFEADCFNWWSRAFLTTLRESHQD